MRIAVLVSGSGTILDSILEHGLPVAVVVADRQCAALGKAEAAGVPALLLERSAFGPEFDRDAYSKQMAEALTEYGVELVVMAGFGTVFSQPMHDVFGGRMLNTHPALLPSFKGWHAVQSALEAGVKITGCTVHVAGLDVDTGPILAQEAVAVLPGDTVETLHERIKTVERRLYPQTIREIVERGSVQ